MIKSIAGTITPFQLVIKNKTENDWSEELSLHIQSDDGETKESVELPQLKAFEKVTIDLAYNVPDNFTDDAKKSINFNFEIRNSLDRIAAGKQ